MAVYSISCIYTLAAGKSFSLCENTRVRRTLESLSHRLFGTSRRAFLTFAVLHAVVLMLIPRDPAFQTEIFRNYAVLLFDGLLPYVDFDYEYPPLSLILLALPGPVADFPATYAFLFGAEMLAFDLLALYALSKVGRRPVILYGIGMLLFWRLPFIRHDPAMVSMMAVGAVALLRGRGVWAALLWGLGGAMKLYPMVAIPALAFGASLWQTIRRWFVAGAVFVVGIAWGFVAFGTETVYFFIYHTDRPAMVESIPANLQLLLPAGEVVHSFGSFNVVGPYSAGMVTFFDIFQVALVALALGLGFLRRDAIFGAAAAIYAWAVFGKVLSPHFLMWPLPLLALCHFRYEKTTWGLLFATIALTTFINEQYWAIDGNLAYFTALLTIRNLLLFPLFALILLPPAGGSWWRPAKRDKTE